MSKNQSPSKLRLDRSGTKAKTYHLTPATIAAVKRAAASVDQSESIWVDLEFYVTEDDKKDAVDRLLDAARQYDNAGNAAAAAEARDAAARAENADNPDDLRDIEREFNASAPSPIQFEDDVITPGDPGEGGEPGGEGGEPGGGGGEPGGGGGEPGGGVTTAEAAETSNLCSSAR